MEHTQILEHKMFEIFHRYDNHFIIKALVQRYGDLGVDLTACTKQKFSRIKVAQKFIFLDSFSHLSMSLDKLAKNLRDKGDEYFPLIREEFTDEKEFQACLQKLVYPYSYIDNFTKFEEEIPTAEKFYNDLTDEEISEESYQRLLNVCDLFKIRTLGELHDLYLKIDVLILASVFEFYRDMGLREYGLDPAFYISAPSFSFDAMLFKCDIELELFSDISMYTFVEKGMRVSYHNYT